jgi:hypothetical protein
VAHAVLATTVWFIAKVLKLLVLVWQASQVPDPVGMWPVAGFTTVTGVPGKLLPVSWHVAHATDATDACCVAPICHAVNVLVLVWQVSHDALAVMCPPTCPSPGPAAP